MRDWTEARPFLARLVAFLRSQPEDVEAQRWFDLIKTARVSPQMSGGLRGWSRTNDSKDVETLQANFDLLGHLGRVWVPGARKAVWNPFGIKFYSDPTQISDRRFDGMLTVGSIQSTYVGFDRHLQQVVVYHTVDETEKV